MGGAKKAMFDNDQNDELFDFLKDLSDRGLLQGAVGGIALQVIDKGVESMKGEQEPTIDSFVEEFKRKNSCKMNCGNVSSLSDYLYIFDSDSGLCSYCEHDMEKLEKE